MTRVHDGLRWETVGERSDGVDERFPIRAGEEEGFVPTADAVCDAMGPRTRMLILNSPSNPAGSVYSRDEMRALAHEAEDRDVVVVSDEIYEKILYEGEHVSPASFDGMFEQTVTVNGFSKTYSMTGWRLGWLVAPKPLYQQIVKVQEHTITCATAFAQKAGVAALHGPMEPLQKMVEEFRARRNLVLAELAKIPRAAVEPPRGAFYVFPRIDATVDSTQLCERILKAGDGLGQFQCRGMQYAAGQLDVVVAHGEHCWRRLRRRCHRPVIGDRETR